MKNEMFYGHEYTYQTLEELRLAMEEYIEYYNTQRITTKLKGLLFNLISFLSNLLGSLHEVPVF